MINVRRPWLAVTSLLLAVPPASVQFLMPPPMPMMPPPMMPFPFPPPPMPPLMPMSQLQFMMPQFAFKMQQGTTPPTTTAVADPFVAYPVPMPMAVQVAMPGPSPPDFCKSRPSLPECPVCPPCVCAPSCTPSFFAYCSACHLKCRCKSREDTPVPIPPQPPKPVDGPAYPVGLPPVGAPNVYVIPYPKDRSIPKIHWGSDSESAEDCSEEDSEPSHKRRRKGKWSDLTRRSGKGSKRKHSKHSKHGHKKRKHKRRLRMRGPMLRSTIDNMSEMEKFHNDYEEINPLLFVKHDEPVREVVEQATYTDPGRSKLEELNVNRRVQRVRVVADNNPSNPRVIVTSEDLPRHLGDYRRRLVSLRRPNENYDFMGGGKKELVFKAPTNKKVANLSVVFNVE